LQLRTPWYCCGNQLLLLLLLLPLLQVPLAMALLLLLQHPVAAYDMRRVGDCIAGSTTACAGACV
jgi:hypothetical protein